VDSPGFPLPATYLRGHKLLRYKPCGNDIFFTPVERKEKPKFSRPDLVGIQGEVKKKGGAKKRGEQNCSPLN